jgi:hypothetical protein
MTYKGITNMIFDTFGALENFLPSSRCRRQLSSGQLRRTVAGNRHDPFDVLI